MAERRRLPGRFLLLLGAFSVSALGDWLYKLALPLLALHLTGSALSTAAVYALENVPFLLFSVLGGVAADRLDRRRLLIVSDLVSVLVVGGLALLTWRGSPQVWMVYAAAFLVAGFPPFYHPAFQSLIPALVAEPDLVRANARMQTAQSVLDLLGPAAGGAAVALLGFTGALGLDALSFGASAAAIAGMSVAARAAPAAGALRLRSAIAEGFAELRRQPALLWGSLFGAGSTFGVLLVESNLIFYLVRFRGLPVTAVGLVFAAQGAGSVVGAWLAPALSRRAPLGVLVVAGMLGAGVATALLLVLTFVAGIALAWAGVGLSVVVLAVSWYTFRHRLVPDELMGRVVALTRMIAWSALPVAPIVGGALLGATGSMPLLVAVAAAVQVASAAGAWFVALRRAPAGRVQSAR